MKQTDLKTILHYCPETGVFTWKARAANRVQVGDVAGMVRPDGYVTIGANGSRHLAHRLAWLYMAGAWPSGVVDHMNGDRTDNRWSNLRDVRPAENNANRRKVRTDAGEGHAYPGVLYVGETSPAKGGKRYRNAMHWRVLHHMEGRPVVRHAETLLDAVALKMRLQMGAEAPQRRQKGQPLPRCTHAPFHDLPVEAGPDLLPRSGEQVLTVLSLNSQPG
jgi:hypothetical protein